MKILLVDDDKDCLNDIAEALEPSNYICKKQSSPVEAFRLYKKKKFDVVITDIRMPEMTGIELLKKIKSVNKKARIIIITGFGDLETAVEAINNHAYAFFGKPIDFKDLVETLRDIEKEIDGSYIEDVNYNRLEEEFQSLKSAYDDLIDVVKNLNHDRDEK